MAVFRYKYINSDVAFLVKLTNYEFILSSPVHFARWPVKDVDYGEGGGSISFTNFKYKFLTSIRKFTVPVITYTCNNIYLYFHTPVQHRCINISTLLYSGFLTLVGSDLERSKLLAYCCSRGSDDSSHDTSVGLSSLPRWSEDCCRWWITVSHPSTSLYQRW